MDKLQIYRASAGSGKTFLLTQSYLKLAFENPLNFSKILAVTFTNKAAEEMKTRIIDELNNIVEKGENSGHFADIKKHLKNKSNAEIINLARIIRSNILHNYSIFSVSTIDSFVQSIIRAFSFEINLSSNYAIELDSAKVIRELTEILYAKVSDDNQLQKWLIKFAEFKISEGKNWDYKEEIGVLAQEIFKEKFQKINNTDNEDNKDNIVAFLTELYKIKNKFELKMKTIAELSNRILNNAGILEPKSLGKNFGIIANYLTKKIENGDFEPNKTCLNALEGIDSWHAKSAKKDIVDTISQVFDPLYENLSKVVEIYNAEFDYYLSAISVISNFHSFGILNDIAKLLPEYRHENNLLLISDTTLMLKEIIGNNDAPYIYEKTGNKYSHILIDEFQDTSGFQWANFRPLVENSLSEGLYNLIVGDIKQSIYRWRGGDWKLLLSTVKNEIGQWLVEEKSLDTNWRSKKNIVDFNNVLFKIAPEILQKQYNIELNSIGDKNILEEMKSEGYASMILDAYKDSYQLLPGKGEKKGGRVKIDFFDKNKLDGSTYKEAVAQALPETIERLFKNKNYKHRDITILVRTNAQSKIVVDNLLEYQIENAGNVQKYDVISADSLFISNSPSVQILISAMKYISDNRDLINLTKLVFEYRKSLNDNTLHETFTVHERESVAPFLPEGFIDDIPMMVKKSIYELSEYLIGIFELNKEKDVYPYIQAFQDLILDIMRKDSSDLEAFLQWWDETGIMKSIKLSDKQNAVKIYTIHKSKGLDFEVVIIPFADWSIDSTKSPLIWANSDKSPFNSFDYLPVNYKKDLSNTVFRRDFFDEKLYSYMDSINMLYVAFTRSVEELIIFAPKKDKITKISNVADLLYTCVNENPELYMQDSNELIPLKADFDNTLLIYENKENYIDKETAKQKKDTNKNTYEIEEYPNYNWADKLEIRYESDDFFIESVDYVKDKVNYGILMHRIFSKIKTPNDIDFALQELIYSGQINADEKSDLELKINKIISRPEVKDWFNDDWEVINEKSIISKDGDLKIPDRVLINENRIIVIDFKFGEIRPEHKDQIAMYSSLLEDIYNRKVEAYLYYAETGIIQSP